MNKKTLLLGAALLTGAVILTAPKAVEAYRGDPSVTGPNYTQERHEAMEKAFENKDYTAWKDLMQGRGRATQVVTQENFARFAQAHELAEQGKIEEASQIRQELGLGLQNGSKRGMGQGRNCAR